jgi:hypothetical protein
VASRQALAMLVAINLGGCTGQEIAGSQCRKVRSQEGTFLRVCDDGFQIAVEELAPYAHVDKPAQYSPTILASNALGPHYPLPNVQHLGFGDEVQVGFQSNFQATFGGTTTSGGGDLRDWSLPVISPTGKRLSFRITAAEKRACAPDVVRLCADRLPDPSQVLDCMKHKRAQLSSACNGVAKAHGF